MNIAEKLRKIRLDKGLSLQNMADDLGMSQPQYSNIESGETELKWGRLLQICGVFKMHVIEVITYGESIDTLDFIKSKIEYHQKIEAAAIEDMQHWRKHANNMTELNIKLQQEKERIQAELDRVKKTSKLYSTEDVPQLSVADPATTGKRKH